MHFWTGIIIATLFLVATIIIFATRLFYPKHRIIAFSLYIIGWLPFLYSLSLKKSLALEHKDAMLSFFVIFKIHIFMGLALLVFVYLLFVLFPMAKSPFIGLNKKTLAKKIEEDKIIILFLDKKLTNIFDIANCENIFDVSFKKISKEEKEKLKNFWLSCVESLIELDLLKNRYKTFYQINPITKKILHKKIFNNAYVSVLAQHYFALKLIELIKNQRIITLFNESIDDHGIGDGLFDEFKSKITNTEEIIRLNAGKLYKSFIGNNDSEIEALIDKYLSKTNKSLSSYSNLLLEKPLNIFEKKSFQLWFPIQKKLAIKISYIKSKHRKNLISRRQIKQEKNKFLPGDILLERREWHATNIGIPGYWTHSALYTGNLNFMNSYFRGLEELRGQSFKKYLKQNNLKAYREFKKGNKKIYKKAVIESRRPGVILESLEKNAKADSLAVLRVKNIKRSDRLKIVLQSLSYLGRPYDFDFDFVTDNALVCSELIYKAYTGISQLTVPLEEVNGRLMLSPNQFAEKYSKEYNSKKAELNLILFLDGNEKEKKAFKKTTKEFQKTWKRPKWHMARDFIDFI